MRNRRHRLVCTAAVSAAVAAVALIPAAPAVASTATANVSAGSFGLLSTPPDVSFSDTLNGLDQTASSTQALDVGDATGSGTGWNLTGTSTTFATGGGAHTLPTSATSISSTPSASCDASATCTAAAATGLVSYPYSLPAGSTAPSATRLFNAAANTGMGDQTVTPTWKLAVPANAFTGSYTSTWTISLVSAP